MLKKVLLSILIVLVVVTGFIYFTSIYLKNTKDGNKTDEVVTSIENNKEKETVEPLEEVTENTEVNQIEQDIVESKNAINNSKTETKETAKKVITKKQEETKKEEVTENVQEKVEEVKPVAKHTCTVSDAGFNKWLQEFKSKNDTSRVFYSKADAINYGESVGLKNGYGYFYNKSAISYEDDDCNIDIYAVRLYIPAKTCENDKMMYLKANEEVIYSITYLKKLGYECKDKVER